MNETLRTLETRRSVRKYKADQVPKETMEKILRAGTFAPSGRGAQATATVVVRDRETISAIGKLNAAALGNDTDPFYGAPTLAIVFSDGKRPTRVDDGCAVITNMINAAHSLGVDSCWIYRAREVFSSPEGKAFMRKWGIDEHFEGIGNVVFGYGAGPAPEAKPRNEGRVIWV